MGSPFQADCGFNPHSMDKFKQVNIDVLNAPDGFNLLGYKNIQVNLAAESSDVSIEEFINMQDGMEYIIVATNGAATANQLLFPASTIFNQTLEVKNGDTIVYKFFTDGQVIICERQIYSAPAA